ncbi:MAG: hypothetical protein KJZ96_14215 [Rhodocyclaceae bacterium]|nr:hypothetical protein [Rhodocyclaceae bacterium]
MNTEYAIKSALEECLSSGKYVQLFLDDMIDLVTNQNVSPEVIFREIRAMEGKEEPLLTDFDVEPCQVWFGDHEIRLNRSPSATKKSSEFCRLPLRGLHHKHYYVHQSDFAAINVKNQQKKYAGAPPLGSMIARVAEGNLTGEWIIFKKVDGIHTYLCLAKHTDGDKAIHDRLLANDIDLG